MLLARTGCLLLIFCLASRASAQYQAASENLIIQGKSVATWNSAGTSIVQIEGPVTIKTERATMTAKQAVIWITPAKDAILSEQKAEISLIGDADLEQPNAISRTGDRLYVDALIRGAVRISADTRTNENLSQSDVYRLASAMRPLATQTPQERQQAAHWLLQQPWALGSSTTAPASQPSTQPAKSEPIHFEAGSVKTQVHNGRVVIVLTKDVLLVQQKVNGEVLQMQANYAVLFTPFTNLREAGSGGANGLEDAIVGAYLEGDVRLTESPAPKSKKMKRDLQLRQEAPMPNQPPEQRLLANRLYYDTTTDRAVLTDVVMHTFDNKRNLPIVLRADTVRQLSLGEITAEHGQITSSLFSIPSFSVGASSIYTHQTKVQSDETGLQTQTDFIANDATLRLGPWSVFYFPQIGGTVNDKDALRNLKINSSNRYGLGLGVEWGAFETFGKIPPRDFDLTYATEFFTKRGPAVGVDGKYVGDLVTENSRQPWSFDGDFSGILIHDTGDDTLGRGRIDVTPPTQWRGRFYWEHQHYFPDNWTVQLTAGYISDPTYFEEWYQDQFWTTRPRQTSIYVEHTDQNSNLTFLYSVQPNNFVTSSDLVPSQTEVERVPALTYNRIGDSFLGDSVTTFSQNSISGQRFQPSHYNLTQQGYAVYNDGFQQSPGIPAIGLTGTPTSVTYRADFREEIDFPFSAGQFRVVPFAVGRFTPYTNSPDGSSPDRVYGGAGLRVATTFWKVDDNISSNLFDIHRLRHVIQPEFMVYAGAENIERSELLDYDQPVDAITEAGAVQFALHQRWQTKRGGPGRWRNVDVFTLNLEYNYFFNKPPKSETNPTDFRSLFYSSAPETSIPRDGVNADATYLLSDTTAIAGDAYYNTQENKIATGSVTLLVQHDPRMSYAVSYRFVNEDFIQFVRGNEFQFLSQKLFSVNLYYQLTSKYTFSFNESYDFGNRGNITTEATLTRKFDRFLVGVNVRIDRLGQESFLGFNIYPEGLAPKRGSGALQNVFGR